MEEKEFVIDEHNTDGMNPETNDEGAFVDENSAAAETDVESGESLTKTETAEDGTEESDAGDGDEKKRSNEETIETPRKYRVKFNHEERELDEAETVLYAQKGMKYEQVEGELKLCREVAKKLGHSSVAELAKAVDEGEKQKLVEEYMESGVPEALAKRLATEDLEKTSRKIKEEFTEESNDDANSEALKRKEIAEFVRAFPDVKHIPKEVVEYKNRQGVSLAVAYAAVQVAEAKKENTKLKKSSQSVIAAPVRGATKHGSTGATAKDPFVEGFDEA